jgi:hypothetical protein
MMSYARRLAVPGQSHRLPWLAWLLLPFLALGIAMLNGAQGATTTQSPGNQNQATPDRGNGLTRPQRQLPGNASRSTPGVLRPRTNPDPGMTVVTPNPQQFPTPVIRPPGTQGHNPQVVPK